MENENRSYRCGFAKGIEIYTSNKSKGYFADEDNLRCIRSCRKYADAGYKHDIRLTDNQVNYYYGMADGIEYGYKKDGTVISSRRQPSNLEKYEYKHYYGKDIDDEIFGN